MIGHLILRLVIWFLLTSDVSTTNIIIGVAIAFLLPRSYTSRETLGEWLRMMASLLKAIPDAYIEAVEIIFRPHNYEDITLERVKPRRSNQLIFLDIFLITFTPKTIVVKHHELGFYAVHRISRRPRP